MADDDVIAEILRGRDPQEHPADVVTLCTSMALIMFGHRTGQAARHPAIDPDEGSRFFTRLLGLSGKILCPIMDFVKPEEYVIQMRAARLAFRGISDDPDLLAAYLHTVRMLERDRQLDDLERAVEARVWQYIRPQATR